MNIPNRPATAVAGAATRGQLGSLWGSFAGSERAILVTFANVEMLHTESGDLLKFKGGAIESRQYGYSFTGPTATKSRPHSSTGSRQARVLSVSNHAFVAAFENEVLSAEGRGRSAEHATR